MIKNIFKAVLFLLFLTGQSFAQFTLQINSGGSGSGTILVDGNPKALPYTSDPITFNTNVTIEAVPGTGSGFSNWSGDLNSTNITEVVNITSDITIAANFVQTYTLSTTINPISGGSITGITNGGVYTDGSTATITAVPATGYNFVNWSGASTSTNSTINISMNSDKSVTANFVKTYTLTTSINPASGGSITGITNGGVYTDGSTATITAVPATGYNFVNWSGASNSTNSTINISMNGDKSVTANFVKTYTLTTSINPASGGSITGITNGGVYTDGSTATITAVPATGYNFVNWSGASNSTNVTINISMNGDKSVTANFVKTYTLTTSINPASGGSITGITNGGVYTDGSTATITAVPATGYNFVNWSGASNSTNATINISMNGDKSVTANFVKTYTLTTSINPASGGSITGITNGGVYTDGSTATITAVPATGYNFVNWSGASNSTNSTINVLMNGNKSVTANFESKTYSIIGNAGDVGVTLNWIEGTAQTTTSAANGTYTITVGYGWSGTVTPTKTGSTFTPANRTYNNVISNQTNQDYSPTLITNNISGSTGTGSATLSWTDGTAQTTTSAVNGNYTIAVSYGWSGSVTPSKVGYTFSPTVRNYTNVISAKTSQNFTAALNNYTITGNTGIGNTTLSWMDGSAKSITSLPNGDYTVTLPHGWSGTITPTKIGYTFSPVNRSYTNLTANITNENYTTTIDEFTISGSTVVEGVTLSWTDGTAKTATSDINGNYIITVPYSWSGSITPSKVGYTFAPVVRTFSNVISSKLNQDFTPTLNTYTITGNTGIGSVTLQWTDVTPKTLVSGFTGNYSITIPHGWNGTITPVKKGYSFTPSFRTYTNVLSPLVNQNFTTALNLYTLSFTKGGLGNGNVKVNGISHTLPYSANFNFNTIVNIQAVPAKGSNFTDWSGDLISVVNPTTITMDTIKNVNANFDLKSYTVSVFKAPNEGGSVSGAGSYDYGIEVEAVATPNVGWDF
ncbi:MAG: hypothetical protein H6613_20465 [Ignavibacteriales bacterium]|nr:hypothetical protein [Ignavibacteriales bacterium]